MYELPSDEVYCQGSSELPRPLHMHSTVSGRRCLQYPNTQRNTAAKNFEMP